MELSTTSIESAPDEHTYEPGQESDFGRALIRAGIPCRVYRDEAGELVHEFDCKAPRRPGATVQLDPTMRPPQPVIRPIGHAPRAATNTRTRGSRRGSRASSSSSDDPGGEADPDDGSWALSLIDRAPFLWRLRALRCRFLEIREGVDR